MNAAAESYAQRGRRYLAQASEEFAREDYEQASEKGWGAASQLMKAVAEERGWRHGHHRHLYEVSSRLAQEVEDAEIRMLFRAAHDLHINFYEGYMPVDDVAYSLTQVTQLVERVESILDNGS